MGIKSGDWRVREKLAGRCELKEGVEEKAPSWAALLCPQHLSDSGQHGSAFAKAVFEKWMSETCMLLSIRLRHHLFFQAATKDGDTVSWGSSKVQAQNDITPGPQ